MKQRQCLRSALRSALARAEELHLASVALRALATGTFGYAKADGCRVIAEEVRAHLQAPGRSLALVLLVAVDGETTSHLWVAARSLW